jgi:uncharacterized membrane protein YGL010W
MQEEECKYENHSKRAREKIDKFMLGLLYIEWVVRWVGERLFDKRRR